MLNQSYVACFLVLFSVSWIANCSTKAKRHGHDGVIEPYDGTPIPLKITVDQETILLKGDPVTYNERVGKSGRGVVIQDINAPPNVCMDKIRDLKNYPKMVKAVKSVEIYEDFKHNNGTEKTFCKMEVGVLGMRFGYFLALTHEPKYDTFTWTLDYKYNSDFDDNVGHWQVAAHPSKKGWTRVLYSTKVKLFPWIPEFVVNFLTGKALVESTTWVRQESEAAAKLIAEEEAKKAEAEAKRLAEEAAKKVDEKKNDKPTILTSKLFPRWLLSGGFQSRDGEVIPERKMSLKSSHFHSLLQLPRRCF